jgi:hypothetical protein
LYEDERRIGTVLFLTLLGGKQFAVLNKEVEAASGAEQQAWLNEMALITDSDMETLFKGFHISDTEQEWASVASGA